MIWHSTELAEVLKELETTENGLPNGVADARLAQYGENVIVNEKKPSFFRRLGEQARRKTSIALIITAGISFAISAIYRQATNAPFWIIALTVLNMLYAAWRAYRCDKTLEKVKKSTLPSVRVCREGIVRTVSSSLLVPGDIILLEEGDYVSAAARILTCKEFRLNESVITGDEVPVEKDAAAVVEDIDGIEKRKNMVFAVTSVVHGTAKAVVVATGLHTEKGHNISCWSRLNWLWERACTPQSREPCMRLHTYPCGPAQPWDRCSTCRPPVLRAGQGAWWEDLSDEG